MEVYSKDDHDSPCPVHWLGHLYFNSIAIGTLLTISNILYAVINFYFTRLSLINNFYYVLSPCSGVYKSWRLQVQTGRLTEILHQPFVEFEANHVCETISNLKCCP